MSDQTVPPVLREVELFALVGEDELGSGQMGLKQGLVPAGMIPLVAVEASKLLTKPYLIEAMEQQAEAWGKRIFLCRFRFEEVVWTITISLYARSRFR